MSLTTRDLLLQIVTQETEQNGTCVALWTEADSDAGYTVRRDGQVMGMGDYQLLEAHEVGRVDDVARRELGLIAGCMVPWQRAELEQCWAFEEVFVEWAGGRGEGYGERPTWVRLGTLDKDDQRLFSVWQVRLLQDVTFQQGDEVRELPTGTVVCGANSALGTILLFIEGAEEGWALAVPTDWVVSADSSLSAPLPGWIQGNNQDD